MGKIMNADAAENKCFGVRRQSITAQAPWILSGFDATIRTGAGDEAGLSRRGWKSSLVPADSNPKLVT
ncbi:MAG TPA: hypothetical protein VE961_11875 [Pyrinomonadaceae bacterium]|nr:hypothetical protein [Pyrinomonadaceae bacterium]